MGWAYLERYDTDKSIISHEPRLASNREAARSGDCHGSLDRCGLVPVGEGDDSRLREGPAVRADSPKQGAIGLAPRQPPPIGTPCAVHLIAKPANGRTIGLVGSEASVDVPKARSPGGAHDEEQVAPRARDHR